MRLLKCDLELRQNINQQISDFEAQELTLPEGGVPAAIGSHSYGSRAWGPN